MSLTYLALTYSMSGLYELYSSGFSWANGLGLQLWVFTGVEGNTFIGQLILARREFTSLLQGTVFFAEIFVLFGILSAKFRLLVGSLLLGFHLSSEILFHVGFYGDICAVFFLCGRLEEPVFISPALRQLYRKTELGHAVTSGCPSGPGRPAPAS